MHTEYTEDQLAELQSNDEFLAGLVHGEKPQAEEKPPRRLPYLAPENKPKVNRTDRAFRRLVKRALHVNECVPLAICGRCMRGFTGVDRCQCKASLRGRRLVNA